MKRNTVNTKQNIKTISFKDAFKQELKDPKFRRLVGAKKKYFETLMALKKLRESKGLTQEELAKLAGVPRRTVTRIESGQRNTTFDTLLTIASAMNKTIDISIK